MDPFTTILRGIIDVKAAKKAKDVLTSDTAKNISRDVYNGISSASQGIYDAGEKAVNWAGDTANKIGNKASKVLGDAVNAGKNAFNSALDNYFKMFGLGYKDGQVYSPELDAYIEKLTEEAKKNKVDTEELSEVVSSLNDNSEDRTEEKVEIKEAEPVKEDEDEVITYTYKPGDTFGQVLLNLGLSDGTNLWGQGGDVDFYTQQLRNQNMLDQRGNVKIGIPFQLRRRK